MLSTRYLMSEVLFDSDDDSLFSEGQFCNSHCSTMTSCFLWVTLLSTPFFSQILRSARRTRRFWKALRRPGIWEGEFVSCRPALTEQEFADGKEAQNKVNFSLTKEAFWRLHDTSKNHLKRPEPNRSIIQTSCQCSSLVCSRPGKATVVQIVHSVVKLFKRRLGPLTIAFPKGAELEQVKNDFQSLCGLPRCGGAIDSTFVKIQKPVVFVNSYWCYRKFPAIILL